MNIARYEMPGKKRMYMIIPLPLEGKGVGVGAALGIEAESPDEGGLGAESPTPNNRGSAQIKIPKTNSPSQINLRFQRINIPNGLRFEF